MKFLGWKVKIISGILLLALLFSPGVFGGETSAEVSAVFFASFPERYDLVALLVEKGLYESNQDYRGLSDRFPVPNTTIRARIDRYAVDLQNSLSSTRAIVIRVDKNEKTENIANVLERLYFDGDPEEPGRITKLKGVAVVGDVPLPVVNKNGNRFISMFPYTDFEDPVYLWNSATGDFELNPTNPAAKVEAWHGVIRSPVKDDVETMAQYFDKNHLYHTGHEAFSEFGKNIFFSDLYWEKKGINPLAFKNYQNFVSHLEDIAYFRYTNELFQSLFGDFKREMEEEGISLDPTGAPEQIAAAKRAARETNPDNPPPDGNEPADIGDRAIPDITTVNLIKKYLAEYVDLFTKYPAQVNDVVQYTGRYDPETNLDSMINLITAKDKFTRLYLFEVNNMLEDEIDRIIRDELEQKVTLYSEVKVDVTGVKLRIPNVVPAAIRNLISGTIRPNALPNLPPPARFQPKFGLTFVNHSPANNFESGNYDARIYGRRMSDITDVSQCSLYRGSTGPNSKAVEANRVYHPQSIGAFESGVDAQNPDYNFADGDLVDRIPEEKGRVTYGPYEEHAGCQFGNGDNGLCFPEHAGKEVASVPVFSYGGTKKVDALPVNADNFKSCFLWREKGSFLDYLTKVDEDLLEPLSRNDIGPDEASVSAAALRRHAGRFLQSPASYKIFDVQSNIPGMNNFGVTFADLLGRFEFANSANWNDIMTRFLLASDRSVSVPLPDHPKVESIDLNMRRTSVGEPLSSMFFHKDPLIPDAIQAQAKAQATESLPVDNPRYVTFQDKRNGVRKVVYPNVFRGLNAEEIMSALRQKEEELNRIALATGRPAQYGGRLTALLRSGPDRIEGPDLKNASLQKVMDALAWKQMDVEEKHQYSFLTYLNPLKSGYVGDRSEGYEMLYLNTTGDATFADVDFQVAVSEESGENEAIGAAQNQRKNDIEKLANIPVVGPDFGQFEPGPPYAIGNEPYLILDINCALGGGVGCALSPWKEAMKQWVASLSATTTQFQSGESEEDFLEKQAAKQTEDARKAEEEAALEKRQEYLPPENHTTPDRIKTVSVTSDFPVLPKGGSTKTSIVVQIKDAERKLIRDEVAILTANIEGESVRFADTILDDDAELPGFQKILIGGTAVMEVTSTDVNGASKIKVLVSGSEATGELQVTVYERVSLRLETTQLGVVADGENRVPVAVRAVDQGGRVISGLSGTVNFQVSDGIFGTLQNAAVTLVNGTAQTRFTVGQRAGEVTITALGGPLAPASLTLRLLPGPPAFIGLSSPSEVLSFAPGSQMKITARVLDAFGNPVTTDNRSRIKFDVVNGQTAGRLSSNDPIPVRSGLAEVTLFANEKPGSVTIKASDPNNRLQAAIIKVKSQYRITYQDIRDNPINSLTVALLGFPAGAVNRENFLAGWFLKSGTVQAVTTLSAPSKTGKKFLEINSRGGVIMNDDSSINASVIADEPVRIEFRGNRFAEKIGEMIYTPKPGTRLFEAENSGAEEGIHMVPLKPEFSAKKSEHALSLLIQSSEKVRITDRGGVSVFDGAYALRLKSAPYLVIEIVRGGESVAEIHFIQNFDSSVRLSSGGPYAPGVSVRSFETLEKMHFENIFGGNSTNGNNGLALVSEEEFGGDMANDSLKQFGVGFQGQNKFGLLFAGGSSFGEANMPYSSDATIVFGDPSVKIDNSREGGFGQDVGKYLFTAETDVRELLNLDYNNDGFEDLLMVYGNGKVHVFENEGPKKGFKDQGLLLNVANGIAGITKGDFNNDGQMDIVVAGAESCRRGETCIDLYRNENGVFTRQNLELDQTEKPQSIQSGDLNQDGRLDLLVVDLAGTIKVYYNTVQGFELRGQTVSNMGWKIEPAQNLIKSVAVHYDGLAPPNKSDARSMLRYQEVRWNIPAPEKALGSGAAGAGARVREDTPMKERKAFFIYTDLDNPLRTSRKTALDENGDVVKNGDVIAYTVNFRNTSGQALRSFQFADYISADMEIDQASIACVNCGGESLTIQKTQNPNRPFLIGGFAIPAGGERTIQYLATYQTSLSSTPKVLLAVGNNFSAGHPRDGFLDLAVTAEGNTTGCMRYFFSVGVDDERHVRYNSELKCDGGAGTQVQTPEQAAEDYKRKMEDEMRKAQQARGEPDQEAMNVQEEILNEDADNDGVPDNLDDFISSEGALGQKLGSVAGVTEAAISKLKCDVGCLALPVSLVLFAPGNFSFLGAPVAFDSGLPVFGWGAPNIIPVWPPTPYQSTLGGRFYVAPNVTTGGVGFGLCLGPYLLGQCFTFAVSVLPQGACDAINGGIANAMSKANSAIADVNQGIVLNLGGAQGGGGSNLRESDGRTGYQLGNYQAPTARSANRRIPGFPSVLTDWAASQLDEVVDKLADLPDIYFIYPELSSIGRAVVPQKKIKSIRQVLSFVNSIPLVDIETQDVTVKIPMITRAEIERLKADAEQWVRDEKNEIDKILTIWGCFKPLVSGKLATQCRLVSARAEGLINTVNQNIENLDAWLLLPKRIMDYRNAEAYLARQILAYLDTFVQYTGGYLKRQKQRITLWEKEIRNAKTMLETWQLLLNIMVEYQESCDQCKTERYTLKDLLLKIFIVLPTPPVIPFPKLPDFVIDISKIQAGIRMQWPQLKFKPAPILFPKLPRISLPIDPLQLGSLAVVLPEIPVIPGPPELPSLPNLPPLNLPKLPDLPPAPRLPAIPSELSAALTILKRITKILCILKTGLMPVPEISLKTQIEAMTSRGLNPLLPIDFLVSVQQPDITVDYVDKIIVTAYTNLNFDSQYILDKITQFAEKINGSSTDFVEIFNRKMKEAVQGVERFTSPSLPGATNSDVGNFQGAREVRLNYVPEVERLGKALEKTFPALEKAKKEHERLIADLPREYTLEASSIPASSVNVSNVDADVSADVSADLADARQELLSYIESLENGNAYLAENDLEQYHRAVAQVKNPFEGGFKKRLYASTDIEVSDKTSSGKMNLGEWRPAENPSEAAKGTKDALDRFIAQAEGGGNEAGAASNENMQPVGLFIANPLTGASERVLAYTKELDAPRKLLFMDFDRDGDRDLIYTSGPDVYLKEFDRPVPDNRRYHFGERAVEFFDLTQLLPKIPAVKPVINSGGGAHDVLFNFGPAQQGGGEIAGYSMLLKRSPEFHDINTMNANRIFDFMPQNEEASPQKVPLIVSDANGIFSINGKKRTFLSEDGDAILLKPGEVIHPLEESRITLYPDQPNEKTVVMTVFESLPVTDVFGGQLPVVIEDGSVEIIENENTENVPLRDGMMIFEKEILDVRDDSIFEYRDGASRRIPEGSKFSWQTFDNPASPQAKLEGLDSVNYYGKLVAFNRRGEISTRSQTVLLAPQVCGDFTPPIANVGKRTFQVPLLKTLEINAGSSLDPGGKIIRYTLDTDLDGDADIDNGENSRFILGPFTEVATKQMRLTVYDEALNSGTVDFTIEIIKPAVLLHPDKLKTGQIEGHIEPRDPNVPIAIARLRNGIWNFLKTAAADPQGRYKTDASGVFTIPDIDLRDRLVVKNNEGKIVAEIHKKFGTIAITDPRYHLEALPATPPNLPTRVAVVDGQGILLTFVFFVPDVNTDTIIDGPDIRYTKDTLKNLSGVHTKPEQNLPNEFRFRILPGDDLKLPGATVLERNGITIATIDVNGDILFTDGRLRLKVKERNFDEPVILELYFENTKLAEIFIAVPLPAEKFVKIINQSDIVPTPRPKGTGLVGIRPSPFVDVSPSDPLKPILDNLHDKGVVEGYTNARGQLEFRPDNAITRAEFTKITLDMLCITPRDEAKLAPQVFADIPYRTPADWFYDDTKEANLQGFIYGYLKEINRQSGLAPFRPGSNITRAEAVKIIIEALEKLHAIDLSAVNLLAEPWFAPYIQIALDLIITPEEARIPTKKITRGEFAQMADRVLKLRNCFDLDTDKDGMADGWEKKYADDISQMNADDDPDRDGLKNKEEFDVKTNPLDPDTDDGGIKDGEEVKLRQSDPLDPRDDRPAAPRKKLQVEEGIFAVEPPCSSCPCLADITEGADLLPGDIIFAAIMKEDSTEIFVKSNDATY